MNQIMMKMLGNYLQKRSVKDTQNIRYLDFKDIFGGAFNDNDIKSFIKELYDERLLRYRYNVSCPYCGEISTFFGNEKLTKCEICNTELEELKRCEFSESNLQHCIYCIDREEYMDFLKENDISLELENQMKYNSKDRGIISISELNSDMSLSLDEFSIDELCKRVEIGVITAISKEYAAMYLMMNSVRQIHLKGKGAGHSFYIGELAAANGGKHFIAIGLCSEMGNNNASIRVTTMKEHFPKLNLIIMTGIAGGIPNPKSVEDHVRLGDIVVSSKVVQYDLVKDDGDRETNRSNSAKPSPILKEAIDSLKTKEYLDIIPWHNYIDEKIKEKVIFKKPDIKEDKLYDENGNIIEHPKDESRTEYPKVFYGVIASANTLLKNRDKRDKLRDMYKVKAVEMEASGIADASDIKDIGYIVVRGICDYCDSHKNDTWQEYAAIVAAAYTRALIEELPKFEEDDDKI